MNIRGINRISSFLGGSVESKKDGSLSVTTSENDANAREEQRRKRRQMRLTTEQIDEAFRFLLEGLQGTGLRAEKTLEGETWTFRVFDQQNALVRELSGVQIVDLFFDRAETKTGAGTLLRRSA
jgi:hypothetical protein